MQIVIVGGGIIGLTTGLYLLEQDAGHDVTIVTEVTSPNTTADGAAGIWGPYLLGDTPIEKQRRWAKETHDFVAAKWNSPDGTGGKMGLSLVSSTRLNLEEHPPIWHDIVFGFRELTDQELKSYGRLNGKAHSHGYEFLTFTIEPVKFLPFIIEDIKKLGGHLVTGQKVTDLTLLGSRFDLVINCTGVGAQALAGDRKVEPLRGQVMRVDAPWIKKVVLDDSDDGNYIISNQDSVVLGGTHTRDWNLNPSQNDREFIWKGSKELSPESVAGAEYIKDWVGLRPGRPSVRLERETRRRGNKKVEVIHNYGHGGSGITIFWGCARDVWDLVKEVEEEKKYPASKL